MNKRRPAQILCRSRYWLLPCFIPALLSGPVLAGPNYTDTGSSRSDPYGIRSPEYQMPDFSNTGTRHHRFGEQTGIGSSYLQTTGTTAETMPRFRYTPTSVTPAVGPTLSSSLRSSLQPTQAGTGGLLSGGSYSSRFVSPALGATTGSLSLSLTPQTAPVTPALTAPPSQTETQTDTHNGSAALPLPGRATSTGRAFMKELINPLQGL